MDDSACVGGGQALGDLHSDLDRLAIGNRATAHPLAQVLPLEQLRHHERGTREGADVVDDQDIGVVELAGGTSLELEATQPLLVLTEI